MAATSVSVSCCVLELNTKTDGCTLLPATNSLIAVETTGRELTNYVQEGEKYKVHAQHVYKVQA